MALATRSGGLALGQGAGLLGVGEHPGAALVELLELDDPHVLGLAGRLGLDRLGVAGGLGADLVGVALGDRPHLRGLLLGEPEHRRGAAAEAGVRRVLGLVELAQQRVERPSRARRCGSRAGRSRRSARPGRRPASGGAGRPRRCRSRCLRTTGSGPARRGRRPGRGAGEMVGTRPGRGGGVLGRLVGWSVGSLVGTGLGGVLLRAAPGSPRSSRRRRRAWASSRLLRLPCGLLLDGRSGRRRPRARRRRWTDPGSCGGLASEWGRGATHPLCPIRDRSAHPGCRLDSVRAVRRRGSG